MCEAFGRLTIQYTDPRGYVKGRIGHQGFYIPWKGGKRMADQAKAANGQLVDATTVRGMLVRLRIQ